LPPQFYGAWLAQNYELYPAPCRFLARTRDNNVRHAKPDLRVLFKWMINRSGSVVTDFVTLIRKSTRTPYDMTVRKQIRSFGVRYLIRNALVILSFGLLTLLLGSILPTFPGWLLAVLLLGTVLLIIAIEQYGYKTFRCPNCSERLPKASIWDGDEEIICFVCSDCDIEWDTGLRIPHN